jgi:flavin-binding protein dodecin
LQANSASKKEVEMSVARVTEIIASSNKSFDDAIQQGIARATKTLEGVKGAWISEQTVKIENDKITEYRVNLKVTFVLQE